MADEDITLDGKPLHSLRVADLKAALEKRNLPKSGPKNMLIKRLKGALMLENLQKSSSSHSGLQPNFQIGEEMCQNSFIKQYLAKQQELLCQRLEKEAQQGASESPAAPEEDEDHSEDNDSSSYVSDKSALARAEERGRGRELVVEHGMTAYDADMNPGPTVHHQEAPEAPGARMQQATFHQGHKEPPAPSPPCAVASLSVRVLDQPDQQGLPPAMPRAQENEGTAPSELGSAHSVLHLSRSARVSAGSNFHDDSDEDHDGDDESDDDDEDWGPGPGGARRDSRGPSQPQQMLPSVSSAVARSKRKLQPPQHIPVPQVHHTHTPMQLRHPTPPPSPPPDLFPLPDTPKQSPPNTGNLKGEGPEPGGGPRVVSFPPPTMQRQYSDSSSRSSSPEPPMKRRSGPLSLLVHRMESEGAFHADEPTSAAEMSGETTNSTAGSSSESPPQSLERKRQQEKREVGEKRQLKEEKEKEPQQEKEREALEQEREKKRLEEEVEKERKRLEEEEEKGRKSQEEQKEKQSHEEEKRREEKQLKGEYDKRWQSASKDIVVVTEAQDSDSSSDSDSKSDSSSHSSQSSSSGDKSRQLKRAAQGQETEEEKKNNLGKMAEKQYLPKREVSEPSTAAVTEVEPDLERAMAQQPASVAEPENSGGHLEESTTTKAFAARKISLTSTKTSPATTDGGAGEPETGTAAGRKRRWGSSTAVTAKKPSITITTDSLKSLIPDIKAKQEAVEVELHPEEMQLSGDEENLDTSHADQDKGLKIQRTVTQVVPGDSQENGQTNEEEEVEKSEKEKQRRISRDKRKTSVTEEGSETRTSVKPEEESVKVAPSNSLVRRSISQQKSGMSVTIDDPVRTTRQPSPPRGKVSNIIHVTNLVRPFTLGQLKELLSRTGSVVEEGFWIDKIKSHCYVTYVTTEEAVATRTALHGVKWPQSNPKVLNVDFCEQHELNFHKWGQKPEKGEDRVEDHVAQPGGPQNRLPPLMPEKDRDRERDRDRDKEREQDRERDHGAGGVRDLWAERERAMERRERARGEREWDRDKVREFVRPGEDGRRSRSRERERRRRDRAKSKERKTEKKEKGDEPPAKLLDDLFLKTKAAPCIYWLPLTEEQAAQRLLERTERQKERERRHKEQKEEVKKSEEVKKEQPKGQEKDAAVTVNSGAAGRGPTGDRERDRGGDRERDRGGDRERDRGGDRERDRGGDRERDRGGDRERDRGGDRERDRGGDRERDRGRDREEDKKRESGYRPRRPSTGAGSGRRSSSCSNPRDRRR